MLWLYAVIKGVMIVIVENLKLHPLSSKCAQSIIYKWKWHKARNLLNTYRTLMRQKWIQFSVFYSLRPVYIICAQIINTLQTFIRQLPVLILVSHHRFLVSDLNITHTHMHTCALHREKERERGREGVCHVKCQSRLSCLPSLDFRLWLETHTLT